MKLVIELPDNYKSMLGFSNENIDVIIKAVKNGTLLYYKPITIKETDSEPRVLKALVDERTDEVYIRQFTLDYWVKKKRCEVTR